MKKSIALFAFTLGFFGLFAQKAITIDDCFTFFKFYPEYGGNFEFTPDGTHYYRAEGGNIVEYDLLTGKKGATLVDKADLTQAGEWDDFEFNADRSRVMLRGNTEQVYRHSVKADYWVFDLKFRRMDKLYNGGTVQYAVFSPQGDKVAFVAGNNLHYKDLENGKTVQITGDGQTNAVINGLPDWVYEEEFSPVDGDGMVATVWSPDGTKIGFLRFDESQVPTMSMTLYDEEMYPKRTRFKYPKVGERNSVVSAHIFDLKSDKMLGMIKAPSPEDYFPRLHWTYDNEMIVTRLNRYQDTLDLLVVGTAGAQYNAGTGQVELTTKLLLRETDPAYVELESSNKLIFLRDRQHYLWTSEKSGFNHIYLHDIRPATGAAPLALTQGNFDVTSFFGVDEKRGKFYYQTATPTPMDRQIWEGDLKGGTPRLMTEVAGTHEAKFTPTFDYFIHSWSDANTPPVVAVCNRTDDTIRTLVKNERVRKLRREYGFVNKEFWSFKLADGTELNGWMLRPATLEAGKKYPVLFDIYGGPGSQTVQNQYDPFAGSWHQMLVQKGVIVVSVDNRGTGGRGRDFKKCTQLQLGKLETEDQIAAARYLGALPFVDSNRIGIWGWSFGGYLSTSCILKGNDVFKMAIAVAPVTNWKWYDTAYTERYMHTTHDNSAGYENNSPINFCSRLRGGNYLLCHGVADDNVHWQHAVEMTNALVKANKQFDTYAYPNRNHGIYGDNATRHLFTKLTDFVLEKL